MLSYVDLATRPTAEKDRYFYMVSDGCKYIFYLFIIKVFYYDCQVYYHQFELIMCNLKSVGVISC